MKNIPTTKEFLNSKQFIKSNADKRTLPACLQCKTNYQLIIEMKKKVVMIIIGLLALAPLCSIAQTLSIVQESNGITLRVDAPQALNGAYRAFVWERIAPTYICWFSGGHFLQKTFTQPGRYRVIVEYYTLNGNGSATVFQILITNSILYGGAQPGGQTLRSSTTSTKLPVENNKQ